MGLAIGTSSKMRARILDKLDVRTVEEAIFVFHGGGLDGVPADLPELTIRENQVLRRLVTGESNASAARSLGISDRTIEHHRARIFSKLGARNQADLARLVAMRFARTEGR
jgi:DNA-binding CsgD family transcriptional regulator